MADRFHPPFALILAAGLFASAASAQQGAVFPPVPGPYPIAPPAAMMSPGAMQQAGAGPVFPSPQALDAPPEPARSAARSGTTPYGDSIRLPYWMQQPAAPNAPAAQADSRPAALSGGATAGMSGAATAQIGAGGSAQASTRQAVPANRFGQAGSPGTFPGYMAPRQPGWGYAQPQQQGQRPVQPGWGAAPWGPQPGWGYGYGPQGPYGRQ